MSKARNLANFIGIPAINSSADATAITINSSEKVGVGASSPAEKLHVYTTADARIEVESTTGLAGLKATNNQGSYAWYVDSSADKFHLYDFTDSANRLTLDGAGNVGIGTVSPAHEFHIAGTEPNIRLESGGTPSALYGLEITNGSTVDGYFRSRGATGETQIGSGRSSGWGGYLTFYIDSSERMRIDSAGDVGIGISNPLYKLQVAGATADADGALGSQSPQFSIQGGNANNQFEFGMDNSGGTAIGFIQSRNLAAGAQTLSLNPAGGSVLIGKTNKASANYGLFQVEQSAVGAAGYFEINASGGSQNAVDIVNAANANFKPLRFWTNGYSGTPVGTIACTSSSTAYNTSSDYRLKENIVDLDNAINRIKQIPVHQFNFIVEPDVTVDGFLAHEVADIVPEAITGTKDGVDDKGNPEYQEIDQSKLVPLLTKAIQELEAKVAALEAK